MAVRNHDTTQGDGVAVGSPNLKGRVVVLPEKGDATDWHPYKDGQVYTVTALARFQFRREVRQADGSSYVEEYDLQPGSTVKRAGPFEHRVINLSDAPAVFLKG